MTPEARFISLSLILAFLLAPTAIHSEEEAGREVSLDELRDLREQAEADASLADELKARILELYDGAISSLGAADRYERELARLKREKASIGRLAETLRADLDEPEKIPRLSLPDDATFEQAETALARERALLRAHRNALRDVERRVEERSNARNDASRRLGVLDQELETLADQLRETSQAELHPALSQARRSSLLARRVANRSEIEKLRADLALLESRGSVIPTQVELA